MVTEALSLLFRKLVNLTSVGGDEAAKQKGSTSHAISWIGSFTYTFL